MTPGQKLQQAFADTQVTGWLDPLRWEDFDKAGQQRYEDAARRFLEIVWEEDAKKAGLLKRIEELRTALSRNSEGAVLISRAEFDRLKAMESPDAAD